MKKQVPALLLAICIFTSGCSTKNLSFSERADYDKLVSQRVVSETEPISFKGPKKTVVWDIILPGVGTIYAGGKQSWGWIIGGILLWPASMVYQPFIGRKVARNENQRRSVEYYKNGAHTDRIADLQEKGKLPAAFKSRDQVQVNF